MERVISTRVLASLQELAEDFKSGDPFPHAVIDGFFENAFAARLIAEFPPFERGASTNELGKPGGKSTVEDLRGLGGVFVEVDDLFRSAEFSALVGAITGIDALLYDPDYVGGGTHENRPNQDLDPHVDFNYHPKTAWHRRLNLIVYLNPEWEVEWGGLLELHLDPWQPPDRNRIRRVEPLANRAVLFATTERSWHGFQAIKAPDRKPDLSRRSLALYLYTRDRPVAETAPEHSTVYVPRPLPTVLRADKDISVRDRERIVSALVRRSDLLAFLARRDHEQAAAVNEGVDLLLKTATSGINADEIALIESIILRQDKLIRSYYEREQLVATDLDTLVRARERPSRLPLRDRTASVSQLEGLWPDLWTGRRLRFLIDPLMPTTTLTLHGRIPSALRDGQRLSCAIDRKVVEQQFLPGKFQWELPFPAAPSAPVQVELEASEFVCPAASGSSLDSRELAFELVEVVLT